MHEITSTTRLSFCPFSALWQQAHSKLRNCCHNAEDEQSCASCQTYSLPVPKRVITYMDIGTEPGNSYRVVLEKENEDDNGNVVWISEETGKEVRETSAPPSRFLPGSFLCLLLKNI